MTPQKFLFPLLTMFACAAPAMLVGCDGSTPRQDAAAVPSGHASQKATASSPTSPASAKPPAPKTAPSADPGALAVTDISSPMGCYDVFGESGEKTKVIRTEKELQAVLAKRRPGCTKADAPPTIDFATQQVAVMEISYGCHLADLQHSVTSAGDTATVTLRYRSTGTCERLGIQNIWLVFPKAGAKQVKFDVRELP